MICPDEDTPHYVDRAIDAEDNERKLILLTSIGLWTDFDPCSHNSANMLPYSGEIVL